MTQFDPTLDALAAEINAAHAEAQAFSSQAVERAHDAGIRRTQAKAQCQHGDWLPWLAEHCSAVSERTARAYMQLARDWKTLETKTAVTADLTLDAALKLLSAPKPAKKTAQKRLPAPVKTATPVAYLPKPEPPKPGLQSSFEAALVPVANLDLSFPPPPPKKPLTPEQEYIALSDAARRKAGLPVADPIPEPSPESLGFVGIAAMQQLNERFDDLWEVVFPAPEHVYFQQILRPVEEIRDYIPKDVRNTKQAQATVEFLEILTQQARLRLAWLEIHPEPVRPPMAAQPFDFEDLRL